MFLRYRGDRPSPTAGEAHHLAGKGAGHQTTHAAPAIASASQRCGSRSIANGAAPPNDEDFTSCTRPSDGLGARPPAVGERRAGPKARTDLRAGSLVGVATQDDGWSDLESTCSAVQSRRSASRRRSRHHQPDDHCPPHLGPCLSGARSRDCHAHWVGRQATPSDPERASGAETQVTVADGRFRLAQRRLLMRACHRSMFAGVNRASCTVAMGLALTLAARLTRSRRVDGAHWAFLTRATPPAERRPSVRRPCSAST